MDGSSNESERWMDDDLSGGFYFLTLRFLLSSSIGPAMHVSILPLYWILT